jgi:hypothetical protein
VPPEPGAVRRRRTRRGALARPATAAVVACLLTLLGAASVAGAAPSSAAPAAVALLPGQDRPTGEPADDSLPIPEPSTDEANQRADEIVAGERFQEPPKSIVDRVLEWIVEQLDKISIPGLGAGAGGGSQVIVWIFVAALVGLAIFLVSRMRLSGRPRRGDPDFIVDGEVARSEHEWLSEAERFEADGQWKQALRCRFRALVSALIERGVVRDIPGRTTGEYRVEVTRNAPAVAGSFAGAAELFERAWYGDEPTGAAENARFRALADEAVLGLAVDAPDPVPAGATADGAPGGTP